VKPVNPVNQVLRFLLPIALLAACAPEPAPGPNVLLVLVDTLRADKLGCYGNERGLTPHIDQLAREGALFDHASSHAPWTLPSTASLLTSLYPRQHGAGGHLPRFTHLGRGVATLPGVFKRAGYATASIVNVAFLGQDFGLSRGFDHVDAKSFESNLRVRRAEKTTDAALAWLDQAEGERPFFLLVHYFDPHAVYDPPQPFRRRFAAPADRENEDFVFGTREHMMALRAGQLSLRPDVVARAEALYDGEVAYTDSHVGRLLAGLASRELDASTVVVLTSDHGEEFLEHGGFEHGHTLYGELTDVPLIVRAAGVAAARVPQSVGHVDVAPTVLELAGLAAPGEWVGRSLLPLISDARQPERNILAHGNFWGPPLTSWREEGEKLILRADTAGGAPELFEWRADSGEERDLAPTRPDRVVELRAHLGAFERGLAAGRTGDDVELTEARRRELEALGYVEGSSED
jgi:arylsulfatase A-like enzyme